MTRLVDSFRTAASAHITIALPLQEGPTCIINEEEFFDAVDASLDKLESEAESQERTKELSKSIIRHTPAVNTPGAVLSLDPSCRLWEEVMTCCYVPRI